MTILHTLPTLPVDILSYIFTFTLDYYRIYCKRKGFHLLACETNCLFPACIFELNVSYYTVLKEWVTLKRKLLINLENEEYTNYGTIPSLQHCVNPKHIYRLAVFPSNHFTLPIFGVDTHYRLVSYALRVMRNGYNVLLFLKPYHVKLFLNIFRTRLLEHNISQNNYITFDNITNKPQIIISTGNRIKEIKSLIDKSRQKHIPTYILTHTHTDINIYADGSGVYNIK